MSLLTLEELAALPSGTLLNYHPDYEQEPWKDGKGPLSLLHTYIPKDSDTGMVVYKCSLASCQCHGNPPLDFHIAEVQANGCHRFDKHEEMTEKKGRRFLVVERWTPNPVFVLAAK